MFRELLCSKHVEEYNKLIIKQEFMREVGQLLRWYWDARSAKHKKKTYMTLIFFKVPFNDVISCWDFMTSVNERTRITGEVVLTEESRSFQKEMCPAATSSTTNPTRTGHDWMRTSAVKGWQLTVWAKARAFASSLYSPQRNLNQRFLFFKDML